MIQTLSLCLGPMFPSDLALEWLKLADQQDQLGATAQASTLRYCAERLDSGLKAEDTTLLTLNEAAEESGFSPDHLGRLVREGKIPNAGRSGAPRIARRCLPTKSTRKSHGVAEDPEQSDSSFEQIVQSIIKEGVG